MTHSKWDNDETQLRDRRSNYKLQILLKYKSFILSFWDLYDFVQRTFVSYYSSRHFMVKILKVNRPIGNRECGKNNVIQAGSAPFIHSVTVSSSFGNEQVLVGVRVPRMIENAVIFLYTSVDVWSSWPPRMQVTGSNPTERSKNICVSSSSRYSKLFRKNWCNVHRRNCKKKCEDVLMCWKNVISYGQNAFHSSSFIVFEATKWYFCISH